MINLFGKLNNIHLPTPKTLFVLYLVLLMMKCALLVIEITTGGMTMMVAFRETLSMITVLAVVGFIFSK